MGSAIVEEVQSLYLQSAYLEQLTKGIYCLTQSTASKDVLTHGNQNTEGISHAPKQLK